jgi:sRNA-binding carbon storage regulator CsrA
MCVITRKRGEYLHVGTDLVIRMAEVGRKVSLELIGAHRGYRHFQRCGQVITIGDEVAVKLLGIGVEPTLYVLASDKLKILRGELTDHESLVEGLRAELLRRAQQRQQAA